MAGQRRSHVPLQTLASLNDENLDALMDNIYKEVDGWSKEQLAHLYADTRSTYRQFRSNLMEYVDALSRAASTTEAATQKKSFIDTKERYLLRMQYLNDLRINHGDDPSEMGTTAGDAQTDISHVISNMESVDPNMKSQLYVLQRATQTVIQQGSEAEDAEFRRDYTSTPIFHSANRGLTSSHSMPNLLENYQQSSPEVQRRVQFESRQVSGLGEPTTRETRTVGSQFSSNLQARPPHHRPPTANPKILNDQVISSECPFRNIEKYGFSYGTTSNHTDQTLNYLMKRDLKVQRQILTGAPINPLPSRVS